MDTKPVQFMNAMTPINFRGTRDRQEIRALALRAASFSRPNRRRKSARTGLRGSSNPDPPRPAQKSCTRNAEQGVRYCFFCGEVVDPSDEDAEYTPDDAWSSTAWHRTCSIPQFADSSSTATAPNFSIVPPTWMSDPFDTSPVPISAESHDILKYAKFFTYAINWPDELSACREGGSLWKVHQQMYRNYFEHVAPLNGLLSYVYNLMAISHPERAAFYRQRSMEFAVKCFKGLRSLIQSLDYSHEQLSLLLQTIWPLASAEYSESVRTGSDRSFQHRYALRRLIHLLGGLKKIPLVHRELFVHFFAKIAVATDTRTEIDPESWDPGPWLGGNADHPRSASPTPASTVSDSLPRIMVGLRELVAVENIKRRGNWSNEDHLSPIFRWTYLRRIALKMRLWNLSHPAAQEVEYWDEHAAQDSQTIHTPPSQPSLEPCLRLAAQIFIYLSLETPPSRQPWGLAPIQHAEMVERIEALDLALLRETKQVDWTEPTDSACPDQKARQEHARDLLWIVAIGACFEEEMRRQQQRDQLGELRLTAVAAGYWGRKQCLVWQEESEGDGAVRDETRTRWFSSRLGPLARRVGYPHVADMRAMFKERYVYDDLTLDENVEVHMQQQN